jgi:1,3-beta-glucanosyltransferase GAS5
LSGAGSQNSGDSSTEITGTVSAGSGTVTETATSSSKKSDGVRVPPFNLQGMIVGVTVLFSIAGGMALL